MIQSLIPISTGLITSSTKSLRNARIVGNSIKEKNNKFYQTGTNFSNQTQQSIDGEYEDLWENESSKSLKIYKQILAMKYNFHPTLDFYS